MSKPSTASEMGMRAAKALRADLVVVAQRWTDEGLAQFIDREYAPLIEAAAGLPHTIDGVPVLPGMKVWRIGDLWLEDDEASGKFDCGIKVENVRMVPNNRRDGIKWRVELEGCPSDELYAPHDLYSSWDALRSALSETTKPAEEREGL